MIISQTAKTYAQALIQAAQSGSNTYDSIIKDLQTINSIINSNTDLKNVLLSPAVTLEQKKLIIQDIFNSVISNELVNFLKLLAEKSRFSEFEQIIQAFYSEIDEINGVKSVKIVSAIELNEDYKNLIITKLSAKLKKNIHADWQINSDIIAGLVIYVDDHVIDTSIKNKLDSLSKIKGNL